MDEVHILQYVQFLDQGSMLCQKVTKTGLEVSEYCTYLELLEKGSMFFQEFTWTGLKVSEYILCVQFLDQGSLFCQKVTRTGLVLSVYTWKDNRQVQHVLPRAYREFRGQ
jgi:hypothetical protein